MLLHERGNGSGSLLAKWQPGHDLEPVAKMGTGTSKLGASPHFCRVTPDGSRACVAAQCNPFFAEINRTRDLSSPSCAFSERIFQILQDRQAGLAAYYGQTRPKLSKLSWKSFMEKL